ncbi:MAG TPA: DUF3108 domain-containing protein [Bacteroidales bacterium]|nr:DUF3108 domain-containing protein [Bacteroidales bacterium]
MRTLCLYTLLIILTPLAANANGPDRVMAFKMGEELHYRVYYHAWMTGKVTAGYATMQIKDKPVKVAGKSTYHIKGEGKSRRAFNWFFKVHDRFETWLDPVEQIPLKYLRRTREGNYSKDEDYYFDHPKGIVKSTRKVTEIPPNTQDIMSAIYQARNLDLSKAKSGDVFPVNFVFDDEVYTSKILFLGRENVKVGLGTFSCLKFKPMVLTGSVFEEEYPMTLYVTDDKNRIPIMAESQILVGSVKVELIGYRNLAHPLSSNLVSGKAPVTSISFND